MLTDRRGCKHYVMPGLRNSYPKVTTRKDQLARQLPELGPVLGFGGLIPIHSLRGHPE